MTETCLPCRRVNIPLYRRQDNVDNKLAEPDDCGQHDQGQGLPGSVPSVRDLLILFQTNLADKMFGLLLVFGTWLVTLVCSSLAVSWIEGMVKHFS